METRRLGDGLREAIVVVDPRSRIEGLNDAAIRMFGLDPTHLPDVLDDLLPGAAAADHRRLVAEFHSGGEDHRGMDALRQVTGRRADGSEFPAHVAISKWNLPGHPPSMVAIVRDLTEDRRTERTPQQLEHLITGILESTETELAVWTSTSW